MTAEPKWLLRATVDAMHDMQLAEHGGGSGTRDAGLLESALARPRNLDGYGTRDPHDLAAAYAQGIVGNHPYVDGNNRTALLAAYVFLSINGWKIMASEIDVVRAMLALAEGITTEAEFADWLRSVTTETS
jgi:death on curing protein